MDWKVAWLAAGLLAAGCLGDEAPPEPEQDAADAVGAATTDLPAGAQLAPLAFSDDSARDVTLWENGTFTPTQARRVGPIPPLVEQDGSFASFDISDRVPRGVPTRITAQVDAALTHGDVDFWINVPVDDWRSGDWDAPHGGHTRFSVTLVRTSSEPLEVVVRYDEAEPAQEVPYTVSIRIQTDPSLVPGGVPVIVPLPADATFVVDLVGTRSDWAFEAERASLMLFDPDDALVGHFPLDPTTTIALPTGSPEGEYVAVLSQGARAMRLLAPAPGALRAPPLDWVVGDMQPGTDATGAAWTFDVARVPVAVGIRFSGSLVATDVSASLAGPAGELFSFSSAGGPYLNVRAGEEALLQDGWWLESGFGIDKLSAGTHQAEVRFAQGAGSEPVQVAHFAVHYTR